jgi:ankyrin repeat protein
MPKAKAKKANTPLEAVFAGDLDRLRELIESGADVNESDEQTPLVEAAQNGRLDMVEVLLKAGADVNFGGIWVPLCAAVRGKNLDILEAAGDGDTAGT